jgi:hypothetical protein
VLIFTVYETTEGEPRFKVHTSPDGETTEDVTERFELFQIQDEETGTTGHYVRERA